jgi:hypothetical protein
MKLALANRKRRRSYIKRPPTLLPPSVMALLRRRMRFGWLL